MARTQKVRKYLTKGRVIEYRRSYYWVPTKYERVKADDDLEPYEDDETEFPKFDSQKQAEIWGRLMEIGRVHESQPIDDPRPLENPRHRAEDAKIPVVVAREGNAKMAAYLYAVGYSETSIKNALEVSEGTIDQYLSDVRRGER